MAAPFDHELYNAWLEEHRNLKGTCLGGPEFEFDQKTGMCLRVVYPNPALQSQEQTRRFFRAVQEVQAIEPERPHGDYCVCARCDPHTLPALFGHPRAKK